MGLRKRMPSRSGHKLIVATLFALTSSAFAAEVDAFIAGTTRNCVECDLSGRDLHDLEFKRAKLDRAIFKNANLVGTSLFRSSLVRASFAGANLSQANLNLVDAKWADFTGANLSGARARGTKNDFRRT